MAKTVWAMVKDGKTLYTSKEPFKFKVSANVYYGNVSIYQKYITSGTEYNTPYSNFYSPYAYAYSEDFGGAYRITGWKSGSTQNNFPSANILTYARIILCGNPKSSSMNANDFLNQGVFVGSSIKASCFGIPASLTWNTSVNDGDIIEATDGCKFLISAYGNDSQLKDIIPAASYTWTEDRSTDYVVSKWTYTVFPIGYGVKNYSISGITASATYDTVGVIKNLTYNSVTVNVYNGTITPVNGTYLPDDITTNPDGSKTYYVEGMSFKYTIGSNSTVYSKTFTDGGTLHINASSAFAVTSTCDTTVGAISHSLSSGTTYNVNVTRKEAYQFTRKISSITLTYSYSKNGTTQSTSYTAWSGTAYYYHGAINLKDADQFPTSAYATACQITANFSTVTTGTVVINKSHDDCGVISATWTLPGVGTRQTADYVNGSWSGANSYSKTINVDTDISMTATTYTVAQTSNNLIATWVGWKIGSTTKSTAATYNKTDTSVGQTITATYTRVALWSLTTGVVSNTGGTIAFDSGSASTYDSTGKYQNGATVKLKATPAIGYDFTKWTKTPSVTGAGSSATSTANPYSFTMDAGYNVQATFTVHTRTKISVTAEVIALNGAILGTASATSNQNGSYIDITTALEGVTNPAYVIDKVTVDYNWIDANNMTTTVATATAYADGNKSTSLFGLTNYRFYVNNSGNTTANSASAYCENYKVKVYFKSIATQTVNYALDVTKGTLSNCRASITAKYPTLTKGGTDEEAISYVTKTNTTLSTDGTTASFTGNKFATYSLISSFNGSQGTAEFVGWYYGSTALTSTIGTYNHTPKSTSTSLSYTAKFRSKRTKISVTTGQNENVGAVTATGNHANGTISFSVSVNNSNQLNRRIKSIAVQYLDTPVTVSTAPTVTVYNNSAGEHKTSYSGTFTVTTNAEGAYCENYKVYVTYETVATYTVTVTKPVNRGTIAVDWAVGTLSGTWSESNNKITGTCNAAMSLTLRVVSITPDTLTSRWVNWKVGNAVLSTEQTYTYTPGALSSLAITANFAEIPLCGVTIKIQEQGVDGTRDVILDANGVPTYESNKDASIAAGCFALVDEERSDATYDGTKWANGKTVYIDTSAVLSAYKFVGFTATNATAKGTDGFVLTGDSVITAVFTRRVRESIKGISYECMTKELGQSVAYVDMEKVYDNGVASNRYLRWCAHMNNDDDFSDPTYVIDTVTLIYRDYVNGEYVDKHREVIYSYDTATTKLYHVHEKTVDVEVNPTYCYLEYYRLEVTYRKDPSLLQDVMLKLSCDGMTNCRCKIEAHYSAIIDDEETTVSYAPSQITADGNTVSLTGSKHATYKLNTSFTGSADLTIYNGWYIGLSDGSLGSLISNESNIDYTNSTDSAFTLVASYEAQVLCGATIGVVDIENPNAATPGCSAFIDLSTSPTPIKYENGSPLWKDGTTIVVAATISDSYTFEKFIAIDSNNSGFNPSVTMNGQTYRANITLNSSNTITAYVKRKPRTVRIEALHNDGDDISKNAFIETAISTTSHAEITGNIYDGDVVRFWMELKQEAYGSFGGASFFDGFYINGEKINPVVYSDKLAYVDRTISGDLTVKANACVLVETSSNNSSVCTTTPASAYCPIGSTVQVGVTVNDSIYFFNGWYNNEINVAVGATNFEQSFTLLVNEENMRNAIYNTSSETSGQIAYLKLVAEIIDEQSIKYIALRNYNSLSPNEDAFSLGALSLVIDSSLSRYIERCTRAEYLAGLAEAFGVDLISAQSEDDESSGIAYYKVTGAYSATAVARQLNASLGFAAWDMRRVSGMTSNGGITEVLFKENYSPDQSATIITNNHWVMVAKWGVPKPVTIMLRIGSGDFDAGTQDFLTKGENYNDEIVGGIRVVSAEFPIYSSVTIVATPNSDYKFRNWTYSRDGSGEAFTKAQHTFVADQNYTFYANYARETNKIYKWEGSAENKVMTWRSGRRVFDTYVSMNSARVYAESYEGVPINLRTSSFQSPDDNNPGGVDRAITSQDAVRLPIMRPNKYFEIELTSDKPITNVAVGSSMGALWQQQ